MKIELEYVYIDRWNRPIFKVKGKNAYVSCLDKLFSWGARKEEVLKVINKDDLTCHGTDPEDEPMGTPLKRELKIVFV